MVKLTSFFIFIASVIIFRPWFAAREVIGGDWPYFFSSFLKEFTLFPPSWAPYQGNGFGGEFVSYHLDSYLYLVVYLFVNVLNIPWEIVHKVFFFGFYIASSILSSIYLLTTVLPTAKIWQKIIVSFVFTINTYILMVVGGGQMGVALAYSIAPLVLASFMKLVNLINSSGSSFPPALAFPTISGWRAGKFTIVTGLILALQVMFDPRIAYLSMIAVGIYLASQIIKKNILNILRLMLYVLVIPMGIAILLHASWILPLVAFQSSPVGGIISRQSSLGAFEFFSFASFSQSLSLLHPNWPENIFGKIGFMQPEFLMLPILAYASLLFVRKNKIIDGKILFFVLLGIIGAFLAKGANPPFGGINMWMFMHIPGFTFFRDPTKFYLLIVLSYSVLIPCSIHSIYDWLKLKFPPSPRLRRAGKIQNFLPNLFLIFTILYLLFLIQPALFGQLGGTFKEHKIPREYIELKDFLNNQSGFFRTLWIPRQQRFTYYSNTHPSVEGLSLFKATSSAEVITYLNGKNSQNYLSDLSIKYLIVPYDEFGEIFVNDRKYDEKQYQYTIDKLKTVSWLKRLNGFGKIAVFEIPNPKDHFWVKDGDIEYKMLSPDRYSLKISTHTSTFLLFSEAYSPHWAMKIENRFITPEKTNSGINSFKIAKVGNYDIEVYFSKEIYYRSGWAISILALFLLSTFFIYGKK